MEGKEEEQPQEGDIVIDGDNVIIMAPSAKAGTKVLKGE